MKDAIRHQTKIAGNPHENDAFKHQITVMYVSAWNDAFGHQIIVASHTAVPLGTAQWLEKRHHTYNLAAMQGTRANHVAYHKGRLLLLGAIPYQPFTFPRFANSDRWFAAPKGTAEWLATIV